MAIRSNELMLGDWVRVNRDGLCIKKDTAVRVIGIEGEVRLKEKGLVGYAGCRPLDKEQFDGGIWLDYLDPIPLTPEILEKNGFVRTSDGWERDESETLSLVIHEDDDEPCFDVWIAEPRDWKHLTYSLPLPKFVHELQHALRLCGIDKEIVL